LHYEKTKHWGYGSKMIESRLYFDIFNLNIVSCFYNPKLNI